MGDLEKPCNRPYCNCVNVEPNFRSWLHAGGIEPIAPKSESGKPPPKIPWVDDGIKKMADHLIKTFLDEKHRCYGDDRDFRDFVEDVARYFKESFKDIEVLTESLKDLKKWREDMQPMLEVMKALSKVSD